MSRWETISSGIEAVAREAAWAIESRPHFEAVYVRLFRPRPSPYQTAIAMVGAKPGHRVLVAGAAAPRLAAEIALVTGLNGQTMIAAPERERAALERAAADAGSLIEITDDDGSLRSPALTLFDITVLPLNLGALATDAQVRRFADGLATLRAGGRLVAIDEPSRGHFGLGAGRPADPAVIVAQLVVAGALAARHLATTEGVSYYEARRG